LKMSFASTLVRLMREALTSEIRSETAELRLAIGRQESRVVRAASYRDIRAAEFKVFSQWGEDGIIQHLIAKVPITNTTFVEFGVESYEESNTRFLLQNDNWRGLIIDGDHRHRRFVERAGLAWRYDLTAVSAFITRDNIDELIHSAGITGDIGLLSVDIDGNDYWVLEAITSIRPRIIIVEYNSTFGPTQAVTVPYDAGFVRAVAHPSLLYYGASLRALSLLAARKGYVLVGSNSAGNNAFFVREDLAGDLPRPTPDQAWVESRFREAHGQKGELLRIGPHAQRLRMIADCELVCVEGGRRAKVRDLYALEDAGR